MPLESKRERNERIGNDPNTPHICFFLIMLLNMLISGFIAYILFMQKKGNTCYIVYHIWYSISCFNYKNTIIFS